MTTPDVAIGGTTDDTTAATTARRHKRNRRGSGSHKAKDGRKKDAHVATCGMPAVVADGTGRPDMTQEPGGGV